MSDIAVIVLWIASLALIGAWGYVATSFFLRERAMSRWLGEYRAYIRGERPDVPPMDQLTDRQRASIRRALDIVER